MIGVNWSRKREAEGKIIDALEDHAFFLLCLPLSEGKHSTPDKEAVAQEVPGVHTRTVEDANCRECRH